MPILSVNNLTVGYDQVPVAKDISFCLEAGDYLCIVGENGSGKTTLMKTLLRLRPPLKGEILTGSGFHRGLIGYLPQQNSIQKDFPASVREVVLSGCQSNHGWSPFYRPAEKKKAEVNMARMGITGLAGRCFRDLSGGQQQRVLLARALCAADQLLLLDEPFSGLDPVVSKEMYDLIDQLHGEGVTIIMISHDMEAALRCATHILHIGETVWFGPKDEYPASPEGQMFLSRKGGGAA